MILSVQSLSPFAANPFVYIFSFAAIAAMVGYFAYGAIDRLGLHTKSMEAVVLKKQYNPPGKASHTTVTGGRTWVQSTETSETYVAVLQIGDDQTSGLVSRELYESLNPGDAVRADVRRTRISGRLEAIAINKP